MTSDEKMTAVISSSSSSDSEMTKEPDRPLRRICKSNLASFPPFAMPLTSEYATFLRPCQAFFSEDFRAAEWFVSPFVRLSVGSVAHNVRGGTGAPSDPTARCRASPKDSGLLRRCPALSRRRSGVSPDKPNAGQDARPTKQGVTTDLPSNSRGPNTIRTPQGIRLHPCAQGSAIDSSAPSVHPAHSVFHDCKSRLARLVGGPIELFGGEALQAMHHL